MSRRQGLAEKLTTMEGVMSMDKGKEIATLLSSLTAIPSARYLPSTRALLAFRLACMPDKTIHGRSVSARGERWNGISDSGHGFKIHWGLLYDAQTCRQRRGYTRPNAEDPCTCKPCRYQRRILRSYQKAFRAQAVEKVLRNA
jgi:hypothetical protein